MLFKIQYANVCWFALLQVCLKSYTQFSNLCRHKRMHADCRQQIKCADCNQVFSTTTSLGKHKRFCEGALRKAPGLSLTSSPTTEDKPASLLTPSPFSTAYMNIYGHPRPPFPFVAPMAPAFPMFPGTPPMFGLASQLLAKQEVTSPKNTPKVASPVFPNMAEVKVIAPQSGGSEGSSSGQESEGEEISYSERKPAETSPTTTTLLSPVAESTPIKIAPTEISKSDSGMDEPFDLSRSGSVTSNEDEPLDLSVRYKDCKATPRKTHIFGITSSHSELQKSLATPPLFSSHMKLPVQSPKDIQNNNHTSAFTVFTNISKVEKAPEVSPVKPEVNQDADKSAEESKQRMQDSLFEASRKMVLQQSLAHARMMGMSPLSAPLPYMGGMFRQDYKSPLDSIKGKDRYGCRFCGKVFPRSANLTRHLRTHTGEQPYKCEYCERSFSISSNLQRHVRNIHNKEKPYRCNLCDRSFGQQTNLDRHLKKHETNPNMPDSPSASDTETSPLSPLEDKEEGYVTKVRNFIDSMPDNMDEPEVMDGLRIVEPEEEEEEEEERSPEEETAHHLKYYNAVPRQALGDYTDEEEEDIEPPTKKRFVSMMDNDVTDEADDMDEASALYGAPPGVTVVIPVACSTWCPNQWLNIKHTGPCFSIKTSFQW